MCQPLICLSEKNIIKWKCFTILCFTKQSKCSKAKLLVSFSQKTISDSSLRIRSSLIELFKLNEMRIWVRYPLTSSLASLEPPTHIKAQVPQAQFFVEYKVAVNGPRVTLPAKPLLPLLPLVTGRNASSTSGSFTSQRKHVGRHD